MKQPRQPLNIESLTQKGLARRPVSRRTFLKTSGLSVIASGMGYVLVACGEGPASTATPVGAGGGQIVPGLGGTTAAAGTAGTAGAAGTTAVTGGTTAASGTTAPAGTTAAAATPTSAPTPTPTPPANPVDTATQFLKAWEQGKYNDMYALLSSNAKGFITEDAFVKRYQAITAEASISSVQTAVAANFTPPPGQPTVIAVPFKATFKTARVGDFSQDNKLNLTSQDGRWRVDWTPEAIFKELDNTTYLVRMFRQNPQRGEIISRGNIPLTQQTTIYDVYVVPGQIENEEQLLTELSAVFKLDKEKIKNLYKSGQPTWRMPIRKLPGNTPPEVIAKLQGIRGVGVDEDKTRGYPQGASAGHVVGYVNAINEQDLKTLAAKGYSEDDVIGRTGIEAWGEEYLAGGFGGKLTIIRRDGSVVASLAEKPAIPSATLITSLDMNIQKRAEEALGERQGSIVVIDPNNGAVLALASFPRYDPNIFLGGVSAEQYNALNNDPRRPFQSRTVNGQLPVASTFKAFTTLAALEKGGFNMQSVFTCTGRWTGLGANFAKECYIKTGHGRITLFEGLVQSCDVVYYELGKKLDEIDPNILPNMAKAFGFGAPTGISGLYDSPGQIPDPKWKQEKLKEPWVRGDAVNLAIGQGYMLASPLQLAVAYAAFANGGNVMVPRLVEKADSSAPELSKTWQPQVKNKLQVNPNNLNEVRRALLNVTKPPLGTARNAFATAKVQVAGKTGTAESGVEQPHAWFACYAPADKPKYVVVVSLENQGFGNELAAPTARKVIDALPF